MRTVVHETGPKTTGDSASSISARARDVVKAPGEALPNALRANLEPQFGHRLDAIRIHRDEPARAAATEANAEAYTIGRHVVLRSDRLDDKVLRHELTHVVQQELGLARSPSGSDAAREAEAEAEAFAQQPSGTTAKVRNAAPPMAPQFRRETVNGRVFEVGDVILNMAASTDVRHNGVLLPGPDQAHILVTPDGRLGYEVSWTTPDDPYRWSHLKEIVDNGHVKIMGIGFGDRFRAREVNTSSGTDRISTHVLFEFGASGITLPRLSVQQGLLASQTTFVASPENGYDFVYYETGAGGRGILGNNSLAHELFGHLWLSMKGSDWRHGRQVTGGQVTDPFGRGYTGSVDAFISNLAGASGGALQSPTQGASLGGIEAAFRWVTQQGASHLRRQGRTISVSPDFGLQWEHLEINYATLLFNAPQGPATPTLTSPGGIVQGLAGWARSLNPDQRYAFDGFLSSTLGSFQTTRRTRLMQAVQQELQRPAPVQQQAPAAPGPQTPAPAGRHP